MSDEFSPHHTRITCARWGRKGRPGRAALTFRDFVSVKSEVDQSAGADIVEAVSTEAGNVVIFAEVAVLDPYRHRCRVDFLDNAQAPDVDASFGTDNGDAIVLRCTIRGESSVGEERCVIVLSSQVLAVEHRVAKRGPALTNAAFGIPSVVGIDATEVGVKVTVSTVGEQSGRDVLDVEA